MRSPVYKGHVVFDGVDYLYCNYEYLSGDMISCYGLGKQEAFPVNLSTTKVKPIELVDYPLKGLPDVVTIKNNEGATYRIKAGEFESSLYLIADGVEYFLQYLIHLHQLSYVCHLDGDSEINSDIDSEDSFYILNSRVEKLFDISQLVFKTNVDFKL